MPSASSAAPCWSAAAQPTATGPVSALPVVAASPDMAWISRSCPGRPAYGTGRPVAAGGGVDDVGLARPNGLVAKAEPVERTRPKILRKGMAGFEQAKDDIAGFGLLQVERQAAGVAVGAQEEGADAADLHAIGAAPLPFEVALRRLDLDHVGAHVRQVLHGRGALQEVAETDDLQAIEKQVFPRYRTTPAWLSLTLPRRMHNWRRRACQGNRVRPCARQFPLSLRPRRRPGEAIPGEGVSGWGLPRRFAPRNDRGTGVGQRPVAHPIALVDRPKACENSANCQTHSAKAERSGYVG